MKKDHGCAPNAPQDLTPLGEGFQQGVAAAMGHLRSNVLPQLCRRREGLEQVLSTFFQEIDGATSSQGTDLEGLGGSSTQTSTTSKSPGHGELARATPRARPRTPELRRAVRLARQELAPSDSAKAVAGGRESAEMPQSRPSAVAELFIETATRLHDVTVAPHAPRNGNGQDLVPIPLDAFYTSAQCVGDLRGQITAVSGAYEEFVRLCHVLERGNALCSVSV